MTRTKGKGAAIRYVTGDATNPQGKGPKVIVHVCNDLGRWGKGFVLALSKRWPEPREQFLAWHAGRLKGAAKFELGGVQFVPVEPDLWVANIIGQHGLKARQGIPPVRYDAIHAGLAEVAAFARKQNATVHMPRIGCGLSGGTWDRVEPLLKKTLAAAGVEAVVYDLPE
jgi:O-acetyl-ADP-ribose deacetylase (regulator of RNase III)